MPVCKRFLVSGRVQGVFFRASTAREASQRRLVGWARNLPDGRVEVLAGGDAGAVDELGAWLRQGPAQARVSEVVATEEPYERVAGLDEFRTA